MDNEPPRTTCFSYLELMQIKGHENGEPLVDLREEITEILFGPGSERMVSYIGRAMLVRKGVCERLQRAQNSLSEKFPGHRLKVYYAYRHPEVQKGNFERFLKEARKKFQSYSEEELLAYVHHYMAIPEVGGHTVGGAIDLTIESLEGELDMGSGMADFSDMEKVHTFSQTIGDKQLENRLLLRNTLMVEGFAPYDFEWWHFSYGDREWACYYNLGETLYEPLDFRMKV